MLGGVGTEIIIIAWSGRLWACMIFEFNSSPWCHRSSILRGRAVPPRVHIPANKALPTVLRSAAGCSWKTEQLPTERLPALATVWSQTITLAFLKAHWKLHSTTHAGCFFFPPGYILLLNLSLSLSLQRHVQWSQWQQFSRFRNSGVQTAPHLPGLIKFKLKPYVCFCFAWVLAVHEQTMV